MSGKKWPGLIFASIMDVHLLHLVIVFGLVVHDSNCWPDWCPFSLGYESVSAPVMS